MSDVYETVTQRLVTLFTDPAFVEVLPDRPSDLGGKYPILIVDLIYIKDNFQTLHQNTVEIVYFVDILVKRQTGANATLNDLHDQIRTVARANVGDTAWSDLTISDMAIRSNDEISGKDYRFERSKLTVLVDI